MNSDEFNDLEKFGKVIEKPPEKDNAKAKRKVKRNPDINFKKLSLTVFHKLFCFIRNLIVKLKIVFAKILTFFKTKKEAKKRYKAVVKRNRKQKDIGYKIIETKKQRGNKTIIVRRRVPSYFDTTHLVAKTNPVGSIYYISLDKESEQENTGIKHNSYSILKKSVWDFPIQDKSIFRRTFNTLKIRGLFKK